MKIIGVTYQGGCVQTIVKPDSALLVNDKPFFLPAFEDACAFRPCLVLRLSRLGRNVEARFAERYYDAFSLGMNIWACTALERAVSEGRNWLEAVAFDNSLPVGQMMPIERLGASRLALRDEQGRQEVALERLVLPIAETVERLTRYITIRMGDLLVIDYEVSAIPLQPNTQWQMTIDDQPCLRCKIK